MIALRSSPGKAGTPTTPWTDHFDTASGTFIYHGDHKPGKGELGSTPGNRLLEEAWRSHGGHSAEIRAAAPPILIFRTVPGETDQGPVEKGFIEFCGLAAMESLATVTDVDPSSGREFPNYEVRLVLLSLAPDDSFDWRWIDARRNPMMSNAATLDLAPATWLRWAIRGLVAAPPGRPTETRSDG